MRIGKLEVYHYKATNYRFRLKQYTDSFYCRARLFRYEMILFGNIFTVQWWLE